MRVSDLFIYPLKSARGIALPDGRREAHRRRCRRRA
ncbi:MOSC domain-containing protein, partial [Rhizobium leguminosarum]